MEQSLLIELIRTLSTSEREQLLQFAALPYINHGRMKDYTLPLLKFCIDNFSSEKSQNLDKKVVYLQVFPNQEFVEGKLEKVMVDANKILRSFLLTQRYLREDNAFFQQYDFAELIRVRGLLTRREQILGKLRKIKEEPDFGKHPNSLYYQFLLENTLHLDECYKNQKKGDLNVPNVIKALDIYYLTNRISTLNRFLLQQKATKIEIPESLKSVIKGIKLPDDYSNYPVLQANFDIFNLLNKEVPNLSEIRALFVLIKNEEQRLDEESLQEFYSYLRSLTILLLASDVEQIEIDQTLHELYKDNLRRGYLHYEGKLHPSRYLAVSNNAIRIKNYDWAIEFIEKYKNDLIGENESRDIYRMNLADYLFAVGRFEECLENIPPTSPFLDYQLKGKRLELKALYELRSDLLPYKLDAFKMFLSRTSQKLLSEHQRRIHGDFANFLNQLLHSIPGDKKRAERIEERIREKKQSAEWRWLLEKAIELGKS
ncbi:MAG: hypothetical protein SFV22_13350 [Saprospiraceae bacterium]|nr:hypothetical protein [Saprospiraceae bacterium]